MRNILDYGAIPDGHTVNTKAIQAAIDAGGTVYIPDGEFVTGTLYLKSGGGLHLAPGAVLRASHDRSDYNAEDYCVQNRVFKSEFMAGTHLITAVEQHDIFISGFGRIDGDSHYWVNESRREWYCGFWAHPPAEAQRPGQMIFFAECENVRVQDVNLTYSPFWHLFFHGCENVQVRGVRIRGERRQWVNDGIDIDCCRRVTVSDCIIDTGDDAITIRANCDPLKDRTKCCEDIVITNCILTSYLGNAIRIGVGRGLIKNCMISNVVIRDSLNGISATCRFNPTSFATSVENVRIQNCTVQAHCGIDLRMSNNETHPPLIERAYMRDVVLDGITVLCDRPNNLLGHENARVSDITFRNMKVYVNGEDPDGDRRPCNWSKLEGEKAAFIVRDADDVTFDRVSVVFGEGAAFTKRIRAERCRDFCDQ